MATKNDDYMTAARLLSQIEESVSPPDPATIIVQARRRRGIRSAMLGSGLVVVLAIVGAVGWTQLSPESGVATTGSGTAATEGSPSSIDSLVESSVPQADPNRVPALTEAPSILSVAMREPLNPEGRKGSRYLAGDRTGIPSTGTRETVFLSDELIYFRSCRSVAHFIDWDDDGDEFTIGDQVESTGPGDLVGCAVGAEGVALIPITEGETVRVIWEGGDRFVLDSENWTLSLSPDA